MGKVRTERVKRVSRELVRRFPDRFSTDFQSNKEALDAAASIYSKKLRDRIAGYITRLVSRTS